jgi:hypothetical protein
MSTPQFTLTTLNNTLNDIIDNIKDKDSDSNSGTKNEAEALNKLNDIITYIKSIQSSEIEDSKRASINNLQENIKNTTQTIQDRETEIMNKIERTKLQEREIEDKKKLIETRNRMLQISQEKNIYKKKIIYTLISIIIAISLMIIVGYSFFNRHN